VNALDFVARIASTGADGGAFRARVLDGDRKLELRIAPGHTVVVRGYGGEAFVRLSSAGVEVNQRSSTALTLGLVPPGSRPALGANARPAWSTVSSGRAYAWHDHRLGPRPGRRYPEGDVAAWAIPIVVDGRLDQIAGRLLHHRGPPLWWWLGLIGAALGSGAGLSTRRLERVRTAATVIAGISAGAAALLLSVSLGFVPGRSTAEAWGSAVFSSLIAAAAVPVLLLAGGARRVAAGAIGLFAALAGLGHAGVLTHGYVIAALPAAWVRLAAAVALCGGAVAVVSGGASFLSPDVRRRTLSRSRSKGRRAALPRQRVPRQ
jgi:hypothetical protein